MNFLAYRATNTVNGKSYIGITTQTVAARWAAHCRRLERAVGSAIRKYGRDAFTIQHIASAKTLADLLQLERDLIIQENTLSPSGYNLSAGGDGVWKPSEETRIRMSKKASARARRQHDEETKAKIAATMRGRKYGAERIEKMAAAKRGTKASAETRAKLSSIRLGKKLRKRTPEENEANRLRQLNRTPETRRKMSEGQKKRWEEAKASGLPSWRPETLEKRRIAIKASWARRKAERAGVSL